MQCSLLGLQQVLGWDSIRRLGVFAQTAAGMVRPDRERLFGTVEADEAIGGLEEGQAG
jgi:hypothetical protein